MRVCLRALIWRMPVYTSDKLPFRGGKNETHPQRLYLLLVLACFGAVPAQAKETRNIHFSIPFKHVVVIFQENRTPDNLFQGLCHPPFGDRHSCSTTPTARQYNISTTGWLDKNSPTGVTNPEPVPLGIPTTSATHMLRSSACMMAAGWMARVIFTAPAPV